MYRSLDIPCTNVDTCISGLTAAILNFWVISTCVTIDKDFLDFTQQNTWHTTLFYSAISRISRLFTTCYHIACSRWISTIEVANMTSCLLRSRDVKVMKLMLSCREFICAQSHNKFLSYLFRQKSYTAKSALGVFCNIRVKIRTACSTTDNCICLIFCARIVCATQDALVSPSPSGDSTFDRHVKLSLQYDSGVQPYETRE